MWAPRRGRVRGPHGRIVAAPALHLLGASPGRPSGWPVSRRIPNPKVPRARASGERVAIVNDVINAGSAVRGTLASLKQCGAQPVAIGTLAVYGQAAGELAATHHPALETLASFPSR